MSGKLSDSRQKDKMNKKNNKITLLEVVDKCIITQHTEAQKEFSLSSGAENKNRDYLHLSRSESKDLSLPKLIKLCWETEFDLSGIVQISSSQDFSGNVWEFAAAQGENFVFIHSLRPDTDYYWRVVDSDKQQVSEVRTFRTADEIPRYIYVEGVSNVRDIGGYSACNGSKKVKYDLLYRGGELNSHMTATLKALNFLENNLKLRSIMDLRTADELKNLPNNGHALSNKVKHINIPILAYKQIENPEQQKLYAEVFRMIINPENLPTYLHCWGGADRTGTFVFLLLALLGVDEETILHDYELTSLSIWDIRSRNGEWFTELKTALRKFSDADDFQTQSRDYFMSCGISDMEINKLQELFLTDI